MRDNEFVTNTPKHYGFLDALRGLASLWVVLNHIHDFVPLTLHQFPAVLRVGVVEYGGLGVQVFFTISGFVIAYSLRNVTMNPAQFKNFVARRFVRLTPPYYAAVILTFVVNFVSTRVKHESWTSPTLGRWVAHALYLPDLLKMDMINGVHWTLYIEVQFYLLFAVVLWLIAVVVRRSALAGQIVMGLLGLAALVYPLFDLRNGRERYFFPYCFAFIMGVFIQWFVSKRLNPIIFYGYFALLGLSWALHQDSLIGAGFITGLLIWACTFGDRSERWLSQRPLRFLGKISYSLYLTHISVMASVYYLGDRVLGHSKGVEVGLVFVEVAAAIVVGAIVQRLFEEPAVRWSRSLKLPTKTPAPQPAAHA
jgi:peptidoglycan/LPS O-acetylase OafA/YrhL